MTYKFFCNYLEQRVETPDKKSGQAIALREKRLLAGKNWALYLLKGNFTDFKSLISALDSRF